MTGTKDKQRQAAAGASRLAALPETAGLKERVAKVMARAGLCSRRDAEVWIKAGRVAVNGTVITSPALNVGADDTVAVDNVPVEARERTRLFLYHKPRGLVTTAKDPEGRATVFDNLPPDLPRVVSVGRLDINTEGLLLLTNDGGLARVLELPATGWLRRYRVRANGSISPERLEQLKDGISIDGVDYAGIEATLDRAQGANVWLTVGLREGKNREIKRVLEHLGLYVNRLIRLSFGPFQLLDLAEGDVEEVRPRVLKDQLGETLAREAGVDWEGAVAAAPVVTQDLRHAAEQESRGRERGGRGQRNNHAPEQKPRQDRPKPGARPHVSALRTERSRSDDGPRKRISRVKTEDRKGRIVAVERITVEQKGRHTGDGGTSRNARNFARERREALGPDSEIRRGPATKEGGVRESTRPDKSRGLGKRGGFSADRPATGRALKDAKPRGPHKFEGDRARPERPTRPSGPARPPGAGRPPGPGRPPSPGGRGGGSSRGRG